MNPGIGDTWSCIIGWHCCPHRGSQTPTSRSFPAVSHNFSSFQLPLIENDLFPSKHLISGLGQHDCQDSHWLNKNQMSFIHFFDFSDLGLPISLKFIYNSCCFTPNLFIWFLSSVSLSIILRTLTPALLCASCLFGHFIFPLILIVFGSVWWICTITPDWTADSCSACLLYVCI